MDFGHALATRFPLSSYIPEENIAAVNTGTFHPDAAMYRNRYGVLPSGVKGWPTDHIQHGQSTFWLTALFHHPAFLASHPEFTGVTVAEPPSSQDMSDLQFAASQTLGGAYAYLADRADQLGLLGSAGPVAANSSPGAPGVPGVIPIPLPPTPAPIPEAPVDSAADPSAWTAADTAALTGLIERHLPGQGAKLAAIVVTAGKVRAAGSTSAAFIAAIPEIEAELGVSDPRIGAALGLIALFGSGS